jgi:FemAB-related protein (PEP-CTERM system-associated)
MNGVNEIKIRVAQDSDSIRWDEFLIRHDDSNFYQKFAWKKVIEENFRHKCFFLIAEQNEEVKGVFPLVFISSMLFGKMMCSMPFVNFGSIASESSEISDQLIAYARKLTEDNDADYLEIRSLTSVSDQLPTSLHKISMSLDLDPDPDTLWNNFKSKHRTNIRRVYKENIHVKQGRHELLDDFYELMAESWKFLGTPIYRKKLFRDILDNFPEDTRIFIAYQGDTPIATAFNGHFKQTIEGMWAGSLPSFKRLQPNYVLYWEMMKDGCETGFRHFHLGRSTTGSGAEDFKKKWNAYPRQLYWQYILNNLEEIPQLNVKNPKYEMAIKVWRKLPLSLTKVLGPLISPSIP